MLKDDNKTERMGSALKFLTRYAQEGDEFLDSIVTGDEIWGFHHIPEVRRSGAVNSPKEGPMTMMRCKKKS